MKNNKFYMLFSVLFLSMTVLFSSCKDNPEPEPDPTPTPTVKKKISAIYDVDDNDAIICKYIWEGDKLMGAEIYNNGQLSYTETYTYEGSLLTRYDEGETTYTFSYNNNQLVGISETSNDGFRAEYLVTERSGSKITKFDYTYYADEDYAKTKTDKKRRNGFSKGIFSLKERVIKQSKGEVAYGGGTIELVYSGNSVVKEKWMEYCDEEDAIPVKWELSYTYDSKINPFQNMFMGYIDADYFSANNPLSLISEDEVWGTDYTASFAYEYDGDYPVKCTTTWNWGVGTGTPEVGTVRYEYK